VTVFLAFCHSWPMFVHIFLRVFLYHSFSMLPTDFS
jgi:hypothetical protein